jgi:glutamine synthetase
MAAQPPPSGSDGADTLVEERVLADVTSGACQFAELHFTDVAGAVKSVGLPAGQLADAIRYGHWFDGSALEGGGRTMETDLLLRPDLAT